MHRPDLPGQLFPALRPRAGRAVPPGVVARAADFQHLAARLDRELPRQVPFDEGELHGCSFAKNAAAFFKMSRSIRRRAFSFRSRASSALRAPSPLGASPASLPNFSTHCRIDPGSTPRLLAASGTE